MRLNRAKTDGYMVDYDMRIIRKTIPIAIAIVLLLLPITGYAATGDTIVHKTKQVIVIIQEIVITYAPTSQLL